MRLLREHDQAAAGADRADAELAAVLGKLPADSHPGPPTVEHYDELPPPRRVRGSRADRFDTKS
ncbi:hypothetical protein DFR71_6253 [Nocardia alba]|uniref:Uncharacterized protein n=1 Tax=Nocardia alba TaxID=225051 RepID=A0A4R1F7P0_9NOCA|nr:hypothetical protein DFR71_6253 [Nocardia alba]